MNVLYTKVHRTANSPELGRSASAPREVALMPVVAGGGYGAVGGHFFTWVTAR